MIQLLKSFYLTRRNKKGSEPSNTIIKRQMFCNFIIHRSIWSRFLEVLDGRQRWRQEFISQNIFRPHPCNVVPKYRLSSFNFVEKSNSCKKHSSSSGGIYQCDWWWRTPRGFFWWKLWQWNEVSSKRIRDGPSGGNFFTCALVETLRREPTWILPRTEFQQPSEAFPIIYGGNVPTQKMTG